MCFINTPLFLSFCTFLERHEFVIKFARAVMKSEHIVFIFLRWARNCKTFYDEVSIRTTSSECENKKLLNLVVIIIQEEMLTSVLQLQSITHRST